MVTGYQFWTVFGVMAALLVWQQIYHVMEIRRLTDDNKDLKNRLMAKDIGQYAGATRALQTKPAGKAYNTDEWTEQEKERAIDRIPIN
jgi:hypothetical protein